MTRRLTDMPLEELWELFPITLVAHNPRWKKWAEEEMEFLTKLLYGLNPKISHIGSTAIPGIKAKPIIDILVELPATELSDSVKEMMETIGYICMSKTANRISFNKGYTPEGYAERVFHIHFHRSGDNDEIAFRDYLLAHPPAAREYERLKLSLLPRFRNDRDAYTQAKTDFVKRILNLSGLKK